MSKKKCATCMFNSMFNPAHFKIHTIHPLEIYAIRFVFRTDFFTYGVLI